MGAEILNLVVAGNAEHAILSLFATTVAINTFVFGGMWLLERWLHKRKQARRARFRAG